MAGTPRHIKSDPSAQMLRHVTFGAPLTFFWGIILTIALPLLWMSSQLWSMAVVAQFAPWFVALIVLVGWAGLHIFVLGDQVAPPRTSVLCVDVAALMLITGLYYLPVRYFFALDEAQWLLMAKNILEGYGVVDVSGNSNLYRVGYVAYYMLMYLVGGLRGAAIAPALGLTAFVSMLFLTAQRLYGPATAAITVVLFALTPREAIITAQLIDGLAGAVVFGFVLLSLEGKRNSEVLWGGLCGVVLVIAFLVKETALLCLPLPFLLRFFTNYGSDKRLAGFSVATALLFAVILPLQVIDAHSGAAYFRSEDLTPQQLSLFTPDGSLLYEISIGCLNFFVGLAAYFYRAGHDASLLRFMPELALLPFALLAMVKRELRNEDRAALLTVAVFVPLMAATGWLDWRPEQALVVIGFFHIFIARLLLDFANLFLLPRFAAIAAAILLAVLVFFVDTRTNGYYASLQNVLFGRLVYGETVKLHAEAKGSREFWSYLASSASLDSKVWSAATQAGVSGVLGSGVHFWVAPVPVHVLGMPGVVSGYIKPGPAAIRGQIWGVYGMSEPSVDSPFFILYKDDLRQGNQYVSRTILATELWPWLKPLPEMLDGTVMRRVAKFDTPSGDLGPIEVFTWSPQDYSNHIGRKYVHETALKQLDLLRRQAPLEFEWYSKMFRAGGIDLSEPVLRRLLQGQEMEDIYVIREK